MPYSSVVGLWVYCKKCSSKFQLGPLNARKVQSPEPFDIGWVCKCVCCGNEQTYQRADFAED
jgi:RNase P subunit RPR2